MILFLAILALGIDGVRNEFSETRRISRNLVHTIVSSGNLVSHHLLPS